MLQALWSMDIVTPDEFRPAGVIVFHLRRVFGDYYQEGRVFGGDGQAYYDGTYTIENFGLRGSFRAIAYGGADATAFGPSMHRDVEFDALLERNVERDVIVMDGRAGDDAQKAFDLRITRRCAIG
ncbi:MAG: hypothetical protein RIC16_11205 [Rhodospirillales bacterium]